MEPVIKQSNLKKLSKTVVPYMSNIKEPKEDI